MELLMKILNFHCLLSFSLLCSGDQVFYLFFTYILINKGVKLEVDFQKRIIHYGNRKQKVSFTRRDIEHCLLTVKDSGYTRAPWPDVSFLKIQLLSGEVIYITCFLVDLDIIIKVLKLKYKINKVKLAIL